MGNLGVGFHQSREEAQQKWSYDPHDDNCGRITANDRIYFRIILYIKLSSSSKDIYSCYLYINCAHLRQILLDLQHILIILQRCSGILTKLYTQDQSVQSTEQVFHNFLLTSHCFKLKYSPSYIAVTDIRSNSVLFL